MSELERLYVAGPMTGLPDYNYPAFHQAAHQLREAGFEVVSPAELIGGPQPGWEQPDYLRRCLAAIVDPERPVQGLAMLPDWPSSPGANLEVTVARMLWIPDAPVRMWLDAPDLARGDARTG